MYVFSAIPERIAVAAYAAPGWSCRFHGLTPTAKCGRRIRGLLEPPGWRPGIIIQKILSPRSVEV